jgi:putative endonuclease
MRIVRCRPATRPCVYILASGRVSTLYVGVTSDLARRVWQHKSGAIESITFAEFHDTMEQAILREKRIKNGAGHGRSN